MEKTITIEAAGQIVIPKPMRDELGLREGTRLWIREERRRGVLEPVGEAPVPVGVGGVLVLRGRLVGDVPDNRAVREERIRGLARRSRE